MATVNEKMTAIANTIRDKTGGTDKLTLDDMATDIPKVYDAGNQAGRKQTLLETWGAIQNYGARTDYQSYFKEQIWDDITFNPQYDIYLTNGYYMFGRNGVTDLCEVLERNGIVLDTSGITSNTGFQYAFYNMASSTLPDIVVSENVSKLTQTFGYSLFRIIKSLTVHENLEYMKDNTFLGLTRLETLIIKGTIGKNNFDVHWSTKLSHESLMSIINALKDYSNDTSGTQWVVTIGTNNIAKLTNEDLAIATQKGWTVV